MQLRQDRGCSLARKALDTNSKVEVMRWCLCLRKVDEVMSEYGFSKASAYNWFNRILECLPKILENDKPGHKAEPKQESAPPPFLSGKLGQPMYCAGLFFLKGASLELGFQRLLLQVVCQRSQCYLEESRPPLPILRTRDRTILARERVMASRYFAVWYQDPSLPDTDVFYVDAHEKVIWLEQPVPKGPP